MLLTGHKIFHDIFVLQGSHVLSTLNSESDEESSTPKRGKENGHETSSSSSSHRLQTDMYAPDGEGKNLRGGGYILWGSAARRPRLQQGEKHHSDEPDDSSHDESISMVLPSQTDHIEQYDQPSSPSIQFVPEPPSLACKDAVYLELSQEHAMSQNQGFPSSKAMPIEKTKDICAFRGYTDEQEHIKFRASEQRSSTARSSPFECQTTSDQKEHRNRNGFPSEMSNLSGGTYNNSEMHQESMSEVHDDENEASARAVGSNQGFNRSHVHVGNANAKTTSRRPNGPRSRISGASEYSRTFTIVSRTANGPPKKPSIKNAGSRARAALATSPYGMSACPRSRDQKLRSGAKTARSPQKKLTTSSKRRGARTHRPSDTVDQEPQPKSLLLNPSVLSDDESSAQNSSIKDSTTSQTRATLPPAVHPYIGPLPERAIENQSNNAAEVCIVSCIYVFLFNIHL